MGEGCSKSSLARHGAMRQNKFRLPAMMNFRVFSKPSHRHRTIVKKMNETAYQFLFDSILNGVAASMESYPDGNDGGGTEAAEQRTGGLKKHEKMKFRFEKRAKLNENEFHQEFGT